MVRWLECLFRVRRVREVQRRLPSDQTLTSLGVIVQWLAFWLVWPDTTINHHVIAMSTLLTLNCQERLSDMLLNLCIVKPQLQARDKRFVSSLPAHTKFTSVCPITLPISRPPDILPFIMIRCVAVVGLS